MTIKTTATRSANVTASDLTPINGATVTLTLGIMAPLALDPADAFAIGDALKDAARKAGYNPPPP